MFFSKLAIALLLTASSSSPEAGNSLFVKVNATGATCTQLKPCGSIQDAVDQAESGDTIFIGRGKFEENVLIETPGISLVGARRGRTVVVSAGGREGAVGNAGNPLDAIFEVKAPDVSLRHLSLLHPEGDAVKRDAGVFAWKGSDGLEVRNCVVQRLRNERIDEPTSPGSRGCFCLALAR